MLLAGRWLLSAEWPGVDEGRYYWQHCFYVDNGDFPNTAQMFNQTAVDRNLLYTDQIRMHGTTFYFPGTDTVFARQTYTTPGQGDLDPVGNMNLLVVARWRMFGTDGSYSFHLHRQPIGDGDLEDGEWSAAGWTAANSRMNTFLGQGVYRSKTGSLLDMGFVGSDPIMWQLRHGTKRRDRRGWL